MPYAALNYYSTCHIDPSLFDDCDDIECDDDDVDYYNAVTANQPQHCSMTTSNYSNLGDDGELREQCFVVGNGGISGRGDNGGFLEVNSASSSDVGSQTTETSVVASVDDESEEV